MWVHGANLDHWQAADAMALGYTSEQVASLVWYVTADGKVSRRHKPRQGGLSDQDVNLILMALGYLATCPHLHLMTSATSDDVQRTIDRVRHELYGEGDDVGQGGVDD